MDTDNGGYLILPFIKEKKKTSRIIYHLVRHVLLGVY